MEPEVIPRRIRVELGDLRSEATVQMVAKRGVPQSLEDGGQLAFLEPTFAPPGHALEGGRQLGLLHPAYPELALLALLALPLLEFVANSLRDIFHESVLHREACPPLSAEVAGFERLHQLPPLLSLGAVAAVGPVVERLERQVVLDRPPAELVTGEWPWARHSSAQLTQGLRHLRR
jgi:hypothetical protein